MFSKERGNWLATIGGEIGGAMSGEKKETLFTSAARRDYVL